MRWFLISCGVLFAVLIGVTLLKHSPVSSLARWHAGAPATITADAIACRTQSGLLRAEQSVPAAAIQDAQAREECITFKASTSLTLIRLSGDLAAVRPNDKPEEYWVPRSVVSQ
jgi:hypothetical protein